MWEDSNNHIVATQVTGVSTALNNLEDFICNKLHLRALVCKLCRGNRHLNAVSQARLSALLTNGGSTESRRSTSDTNHSSHDDLLNHILACMPPSARQANNVRLHIKTSGSVITSLCVDVLSVGVLLLFLSPRQTVWGHRYNLNTAGTVIRVLWFVPLHASLYLWSRNCICHSQRSAASPSPSMCVAALPKWLSLCINAPFNTCTLD